MDSQDYSSQERTSGEELEDQRAVATSEAPSKLLLGGVMLLLLLFALAVWGRLPWSTSALGAPGTGRASSAGANDYEAILGAPGASFPAAATGVPDGDTANAPVAAAGAASSTSPTPAAPASPPQAALLPQTGVATGELFVDPLFGHAYWRQGGVKRFGRPTSALTTDGKYTQTFERARFEYRPEHAGTPDAIHIELVK